MAACWQIQPGGMRGEKVGPGGQSEAGGSVLVHPVAAHTWRAAAGPGLALPSLSSTLPSLLVKTALLGQLPGGTLTRGKS